MQATKSVRQSIVQNVFRDALLFGYHPSTASDWTRSYAANAWMPFMQLTGFGSRRAAMRFAQSADGPVSVWNDQDSDTVEYWHVARLMSDVVRRDS